MDRLLELTALAERSHFWFRGFRWFAAPPAGAGRGRDVRAAAFSIAAAAPARTCAMLEPFGEVFGFDLTWRGLQFAREHRPAGIAQASIGADPVPRAPPSTW